MNTRDEVKVFLEKFYECDKVMREISYCNNQIGKKEQSDDDDDGNTIQTGSYIEGAWCTPLMIPIHDKMLDKDIMLVTCTITKTLSKFILKETAHTGYYQIEMPENYKKTFQS